MIYLLLIKFSKSKQTSNVWFWSKERRFKISAETGICFRNLRFLVSFLKTKTFDLIFFLPEASSELREWLIRWKLRYFNQDDYILTARSSRERKFWIHELCFDLSWISRRISKTSFLVTSRSCPTDSEEEETVFIIQN